MHMQNWELFADLIGFMNTSTRKIREHGLASVWQKVTGRRTSAFRPAHRLHRYQAGRDACGCGEAGGHELAT